MTTTYPPLGPDDGPFFYALFFLVLGAMIAAGAS
jgi:hypothetical protein